MAWGGRSDMAVGGKQSYESILQHLAHPHRKLKHGELLIADGRSKNYAFLTYHHTNPTTGEWEEAACVRLYDTHVLQFFKDGTVVVNSWSSTITREITGRYGPVRIFTHKGAQMFRDVDENLWPMQEPLHVRPDGTLGNIIEMHHTHRRLKPEVRAQRLETRKLFLKGATGRLLLGEFPEIVFNDSNSVWTGILPESSLDRARMFDAFCLGADHARILDFVRDNWVVIGNVSFGRTRATYHLTREAAAKAVMNSLMHAALNDGQFYNETYSKTEHRDIRVVRR